LDFFVLEPYNDEARLKFLIQDKCDKGMHRIVAIVLLTFATTTTVDATSNELKEAKPCLSDLQEIAEADKGLVIGALRTLLGKVRDGDASVNAAAKTWLGVRGPQNLQIVETVINKAIALESVLKFRCVFAHDEGTLAAVAQDKSNFVIYLYPDYFEAPDDLKGDVVPSRAGTIFHEIMHMALAANGRIVGADVYDEGEILELAKSDPQTAQQNATNWEHFLYEVGVDR